VADDAFAPVALFVYARPEHTRRTLRALADAEGAAETELFVFADGPKGEADRADVAEVGRIVAGVEGFRAVQRRESVANQGLAASVIAGVTEVMKRRGAAIVLEDDIVVSRHFLTYMNRGLEAYADCPAVFSIAGYNYPPDVLPIPKRYCNDVYFCPRNSSWGWASWADRWRQTDWEVADFDEFYADAAARTKFDEGGADLTDMLRAQMKGRIDSWSIRWTYAHFRAGALAVYPVRSHVDNIGLDGSGVHCGVHPRLRNDVRRANASIEFPSVPSLDPDIMRAFRAVFARPEARRRRFARLVARLRRAGLSPR